MANLSKYLDLWGGDNDALRWHRINPVYGGSRAHLLKTINVDRLAVALDHCEEYGPWRMDKPDVGCPDKCVYLRFVGERQLKVLAGRLPHTLIRFTTMGGSGRNKWIRPVFWLDQIAHMLDFLFLEEERAEIWVRPLASVDKKYWKVVE